MKEFTEDSLKLSDELISAFHRIQVTKRKDTIMVNEALIMRFITLIEDRKNLHKRHSTNLNVFKYFGLGETMHSFLLAKLLNPNAEHGQGKLFLNLFLKMLDIPNPEIGMWTVTAETGRIDILIKCNNPQTTIIIENKSNNAEDQPNQLFRYWYYEIYFPNRHRPEGALQYLKNNSNRYKIIYLVSNEWKVADYNSKKRPADLNDISLPDEIPTEIIRWTFQVQILDWLKSALNSVELPSKNYRLRNFIEQYIEVWSSN